jgi:hypothetical protein
MYDLIVVIPQPVSHHLTDRFFRGMREVYGDVTMYRRFESDTEAHRYGRYLDRTRDTAGCIWAVEPV